MRKRPHILLTRYVDRSPVLDDRSPNDGESNACPCRLGRKIEIENAILNLGGDSAAGIRDPDLDTFGLVTLYGNFDLISTIRGVNRILDQVQEDVLHLSAVPTHDSIPFVDDTEFKTVLVESGLECVLYEAYEFSDLKCLRRGRLRFYRLQKLMDSLVDAANLSVYKTG